MQPMNKRSKVINYRIPILITLLAGLAFYMFGDGDCTQTFISRRTCLYLQTPITWLAPEHALRAPSPQIIATAPFPSYINPEALKEISAEELTQAKQFANGNPGGLLGLSATWSEQSGENNNLYIVSEGQPFIGALDVAIFNFPTPPHLVITCLLDFAQIPCQPQQDLAQHMSLSPEQLTRLPIQISGLSQGLHDLVVVLWQDFEFDKVSANDPARAMYTQRVARASIAVNGDTTTPAVEWGSARWPYHAFGLEGLAISQARHPWDSYGGFKPETHLRVRAGELIEFYLHLFNRQSVRVEYALAAFVDYKQIPITYEGSEFAPLYFSTKSSAWYPLLVNIRAPYQPGNYEFVILGEHFPQARMDLETSLYASVENLSLHVWSSARLVLEVTE